MVARVYSSKQIALRRQFEIGYGTTPQVFMLHRGHMHKYFGDASDQEQLIDFALDHYRESPHIEQVAIMPTIWDEIRDAFNYNVKHKGGIIPALLFKGEDGRPTYSAMFAVYVLPPLICWGFYKLMKMSYDTEDDTVERTKLIEAANAYEREKIQRWIQKHPALRRKHRKWE